MDIALVSFGLDWMLLMLRSINYDWNGGGGRFSLYLSYLALQVVERFIDFQLVSIIGPSTLHLMTYFKKIDQMKTKHTVNFENTRRLTNPSIVEIWRNLMNLSKWNTKKSVKIWKNIFLCTVWRLIIALAVYFMSQLLFWVKSF